MEKKPEKPIEKKEQKKEAKDETPTPQIYGFKLPARRKGDLKKLAESLSSISSLMLTVESDYVAALNVESRDIKKNPYLFSLIYLRPNEIEVVYSVVPGISIRKRKIDVLKHFLNLMTLIDDDYETNHKQFYQILRNALSEITEFAASTYDEIFSKYDILNNEFLSLQKKVENLNAAITKMTNEAIELKAKNDELTLRLKQLESPSDDVLKVKIQEWLELHHNEINISEFAKTYNVMESRVEHLLNSMVMQGYLEAVG
jgi:regulator of replication initiation timing